MNLGGKLGVNLGGKTRNFVTIVIAPTISNAL